MLIDTVLAKNAEPILEQRVLRIECRDGQLDHVRRLHFLLPDSYFRLIQQRQIQSQIRCNRHLRRGDQRAAFAHVVTAQNDPAINSLGHRGMD